jgi:ketosteroid isomerase-like protein
MKNLKPLLASLLVLVIPALGIASTDSDHNELLNDYKTYVQALKQKDVATIESLETDDFTHKEASGKAFNREQDAENIKKVFQATKSFSKVDIQILDLKIQSDQANAVTLQTLDATLVDPQGGEHILVTQNKSRDTWVKINGHWKIKYTEDFDESNLLDGRTIP